MDHPGIEDTELPAERRLCYTGLGGDVDESGTPSGDIVFRVARWRGR